MYYFLVFIVLEFLLFCVLANRDTQTVTIKTKQCVLSIIKQLPASLLNKNQY